MKGSSLILWGRVLYSLNMIFTSSSLFCGVWPLLEGSELDPLGSPNSKSVFSKCNNSLCLAIYFYLAALKFRYLSNVHPFCTYVGNESHSFLTCQRLSAISITIASGMSARVSTLNVGRVGLLAILDHVLCCDLAMLLSSWSLLWLFLLFFPIKCCIIAIIAYVLASIDCRSLSRCYKVSSSHIILGRIWECLSAIFLVMLVPYVNRALLFIYLLL